MNNFQPIHTHIDDLSPKQQAELVRRRENKDRWTEYSVAWWWPFFSIPVSCAGVVLIYELVSMYGRGSESIEVALPVALGAAACIALAILGFVHFVRSFGQYGRTLTNFGYAEVLNKQL